MCIQACILAGTWEGGEVGTGSVGCKVRIRGKKEHRWWVVALIIKKVDNPESTSIVVVSTSRGDKSMSAHPISHVIQTEETNAPYISVRALTTTALQVRDKPESVDWTATPAFFSAHPQRKRGKKPSPTAVPEDPPFQTRSFTARTGTVRHHRFAISPASPSEVIPLSSHVHIHLNPGLANHKNSMRCAAKVKESKGVQD